ATMAEGLEARTPMLDHRLVEYSAMLPDCLKISGSQTKVALRTLAGRRLPPEIVKLPKHAFDVPLKEWIAVGGARSWNQAKEALSDADFQMKHIRRLEAIARTGSRRALRTQWSLLALGLWLGNRTFSWQ